MEGQKWKISEMQQIWKNRRNLAKDRTANKKADIETEMRLRKQQLDRELEDQLAQIAREEDEYLAKYYEYCRQRREDIHRAYQEAKALEGGEL